MNSGIGGGMSGQLSNVGAARSQTSSNNAGAGSQSGQGEAEMSAFMQTVTQMTMQQYAMVGSSLVSNMRPDDGGGE